jgi:hypothetical protein
MEVNSIAERLRWNTRSQAAWFGSILEVDIMADYASRLFRSVILINELFFARFYLGRKVVFYRDGPGIQSHDAAKKPFFRFPN